MPNKKRNRPMPKRRRAIRAIAGITAGGQPVTHWGNQPVEGPYYVGQADRIARGDLDEPRGGLALQAGGLEVLPEVWRQLMPNLSLMEAGKLLDPNSALRASEWGRSPEGMSALEELRRWYQRAAGVSWPGMGALQ